MVIIKIIKNINYFKLNNTTSGNIIVKYNKANHQIILLQKHITRISENQFDVLKQNHLRQSITLITKVEFKEKSTKVENKLHLGIRTGFKDRIALKEIGWLYSNPVLTVSVRGKDSEYKIGLDN